MRIASLFLLSLSLFCYSNISSASTLTYWVGKNSVRYPTAEAACKSHNSTYIIRHTNESTGSKACGSSSQTFWTLYPQTEQCQYGDNGTYCNSSCDAPMVMEGGQCVTPTNECTVKADQPTAWKKEYNSLAEHDQNPIYCTSSQGGCAVDICSEGGTKECGTDGKTGKFVCYGSGSYTGDQQSESTGTTVSDCAEPCKAPEPTTSDSSQSCTTPTVVNGVTSYSCISESNANEFASSNCAVGNINGVTALHCASPDYVPESDSNTRTDDVSETSNPDGGKTTTTDTTDENEHCKAGNCTTSSTSTSTTTTTDGDGKVTEETSTCEGDKCGGKGEEEEEEKEPEEFVSPGGGEFGSVADSLPDIGEDGDSTYSESTQQYIDRIKSSPIVSSVLNISVPSGGTCSIGSASLFGGSINFNYFCTMAPDVLSGLRYLFLAIWAWAAIRLLMTA